MNVLMLMGLACVLQVILVKNVKTSAWIGAENAPTQPSVQRALLVGMVSFVIKVVIARGAHVT